MIAWVGAALSRVMRRLSAYPELAAVLAAAAAGLCVQPPLAWLAGHQGINVLLVIGVFATAVTIDPRAPGRLVRAWPRVIAAVAVGVTVLPAVSWAVSRLVPAGPLRDGVLVTGLAPCEIASVATTGLAGGEAAVAAGVLLGSTLASVILTAPILTLEAGHAGFSMGGVIVNLAVVVAIPLAAGLALRSWVPPTARTLATATAQTAASRTALAGIAALVALVASEVRLTASYAAVAGALALFLAASALIGCILGIRPASPVGSALLLTTAMRDFAVAAAMAAAAFGPAAAAPLGLYGIAVLTGGTAVAGLLRPTRSAQRGARLVNGPHVSHAGGDQPQRRGRGDGAMGDQRAEFSYVSATSGTPLLGDTIGANFDRTAARFPGHLALVDVPAGRRYSYAELKDEVDALAYALMGTGIAKGDRVGIWSPNRAEWILAQYATAKLGAIVVNINPAYRTSELEFVLNQSGCKLLIAAQRLKTSDYAAMIAEVRPRCAELAQVVLLDSDEWLELLNTGKYADISVRNAALDEIQLSADDPINIQYTSGTTGFPKGATLSHHNILNNGFFVGELCHYTEQDRICIPVPFYHCFGMVMGNLAATSHGAAMVIPAPVFDPAQTLKAVQDERCTSLYGVPTMFIAELAVADLDGYDLSSLRTGIMAGSPCPVEVMKQVIDRMGMSEVSICYGMTETSPVSTQTRVDDSVERRVATVGRVGPHLEVKVIDPATGLTVARGTPGELCTRGYSVMLGYWREPAKTSEVIDAARWMHTGDLAVMDDDGYLSITGRIKDMVIRGGENVYPREVEEFLYTHPDILDAQVIGVPDAKYGEELMAWIRLRPGATPITVESLKAFCTDKLAHYKIPRYVHLTDEFPMTVTGKVRKVEMREKSLEILRLPQ